MLPQALSATLPTLESPLSFAMVDEAKSSPCGQSFWLPRSAQPPSARIRTHSRVAHPAIMSSLRRPPCRDVLLRLPWLRHTRSEPGSSGKARKTFAAQNSGSTGFRLSPCPRPEPERLPDHKAGQRGRPRTNGGHHEQFRTSGEGSQGSHPLHRAQGFELLETGWTSPPREPRST